MGGSRRNLPYASCLLEQHQPLGILELTGNRDLIEVNSTRNRYAAVIHSTPLYRVATGLLALTHQRTHLLAQQVVDPESHVAAFSQVVRNVGLWVERVREVLMQRELGRRALHVQRAE